MKAALLFCALSVVIPVARTETSEERGKHVIDEAVAALGGDRFLQMQDRIESGYQQHGRRMEESRVVRDSQCCRPVHEVFQ